MHRLFFAALPDADACAQLSALVERQGRSCRTRWVRPARYHLTLAFLGSNACFREAVAETAMRAAASVRTSAFTWKLDMMRGFCATRSPVVLGASQPFAPLQDLHRRLLDALAGHGVDVPDTRRYVPHVTLGYGGPQAIEPLAVSPVYMAVERFVLLHSVGGERTYRQLGCWSLTDCD
ncbi:MAG TPA: RNA 2',3'-cyclic phosphodiesterase [Oleiagrimonas sp.]|nr:RNA 2',3'-cyclic phosphodiesterase [Oleiagrimonas sp.]